MRVLALWTVLGLAVPAAADPEERLWYAELRVEGPLQELVLDAGELGSTRLELELLAGESDVLSLPVPVRSPLGVDGLERVPLPALATVPDGASVELTGWARQQPAGRVALLPPGMRARPTPSVPGSARQATAGGLLLITTAFACGWLLRKRRWVGPAVASVLSAGIVLVVWTEGGRRGQTVIVEADLTRGLWIEVRASRDELFGPFDSLRVEPAGPIELELRSSLGAERMLQVARAPGRVLVGRRPLQGPVRDLGRRRNQLGDFTASFLRGPQGTWTRHGAWPAGSALPEAFGPATASEGGRPNGREVRAEGPAQPPGWLAAGLPPGDWVLLGRLADGRWVRATGMRPADETLESH